MKKAYINMNLMDKFQKDEEMSNRVMERLDGNDQIKISMCNIQADTEVYRIVSSGQKIGDKNPTSTVLKCSNDEMSKREKLEEMHKKVEYVMEFVLKTYEYDLIVLDYPEEFDFDEKFMTFISEKYKNINI